MGESGNKTAFGKREIITLICVVGFFGLLAMISVPNFIRLTGSGAGWNANLCINNLRQIDGAKQQWAFENGKTNGDIVATEADLKSYLGRGPYGKFPQCPSGGEYTIGQLSQPPTCSLGTNTIPPHVLPVIVAPDAER